MIRKIQIPLIVSVILAIIILFILTSCGARKVAKSDLSVIDKSEIVKTETVKTDIVKEDETVWTEWVAKDTLKPFVVAGIVYENVIVRQGKSKAKLVDKTITIVAEKAVKEVIKVETKKAVEKKQYNPFWMIIIVLVIAVAYKYRYRIVGWFV